MTNEYNPADELADIFSGEDLNPEKIAELEREMWYLDQAEKLYIDLSKESGIEPVDLSDDKFLEKVIERTTSPEDREEHAAFFQKVRESKSKGADGFILLKSMLRRISYTMSKYREQMVATAKAFSLSDEWKKTRDLFDIDPPEADDPSPDISDIVTFISSADLIEFEQYIENFEELYPTAKEVVEERRSATGLPVKLEDFFANKKTDDGEWEKSLYEICIERSNILSPPPVKKTAIKKSDLYNFPLDKVNSTVWKLFEADAGGQLGIATEKQGSNKEINVLYTINFDALGEGITVSRRLTAFDKRVYGAISTIFNEGENIITIRQIHAKMGNVGNPSKNQVEKINTAITKMMRAQIFVNNKQEINANYNYPRFEYDGALLPIERMSAIVNGQLTDAAIHIFREPPLSTFARGRKQITTIEVKLLQSPISKTDANLLIDDYLLERILRAKRAKKGSCRILLATLFENAEITTKKQKQRAPEKIRSYLDHYKLCGTIKSYSISDSAISVFFD